MGLRAACFEKEGGVPADEPPHLTVGGERDPLPHMRPSPGPEPLWGVCVYVTSVPARCAFALGAPSVGAGRVSRGGGGGSLCCFIPLPPPLGAGGWAGSWRACRPPRGGGLSP